MTYLDDLDDDRYGYDEWEMDDDERADQELESLLAECGWYNEGEDDAPHCVNIGSEHCDFVCPLRYAYRRAWTHWRARQRRKRGRGVGPDPRRMAGPAWMPRWVCRRRRGRRQERGASHG